MHTFISRGNALFAYAFSCLTVAVGVCFLSSAFSQPAVDVKLSVSNPVV